MPALLDIRDSQIVSNLSNLCNGHLYFLASFSDHQPVSFIKDTVNFPWWFTLRILYQSTRNPPVWPDFKCKFSPDKMSRERKLSKMSGEEITFLCLNVKNVLRRFSFSTYIKCPAKSQNVRQGTYGSPVKMSGEAQNHFCVLWLCFCKNHFTTKGCQWSDQFNLSELGNKILWIFSPNPDGWITLNWRTVSFYRYPSMTYVKTTCF